MVEILAQQQGYSELLEMNLIQVSCGCTSSLCALLFWVLSVDSVVVMVVLYQKYISLKHGCQPEPCICLPTFFHKF